MSISTSDPAIEAAHRLLKQFDCTQQSPPLTLADKSSVQKALLTVAQHSDYQILGVCANTLAEGKVALNYYAETLGYSVPWSDRQLDGPVYIKFNPKSGLCYVDSYDGEHRGVLVSCQSAYETGINEMYGHLPLDLFEDHGNFGITSHE